ncbi:hypothetical protein [Photobacterium sp. GSS17]|uniref:hypothetical protein n=1 Tax=Photobacterium sp. GSS17 TaxID=3020715 RepID=UPI00235E3BA6|nr:hypothetical protein [Photobacterium sp. GSS17]
MSKKVCKGFAMEELLKSYFIQAGYYVARGVPFVYEGFDVTDIDLWLYSRASSATRNVTIVDVKNKKTPQAIERIFWAKGLAQAVKADNVIIATTDQRKEVKDFGKDLNVLVLDGVFLSKLSRTESELTRLSDEEFISLIDMYNLGKIDGDWKGQVLKSKSLLARGLTFDTCNKWLEVSRFFAEQILTKPSQLEVALRCFYYTLSLLAIGVDYLLRELSFVDNVERTEKLAEGFTYGSKGKSGLNKMLGLSLSLVEQFAEEGPSIARQVKSKISDEFESLPTQIIAEYFSKGEVARTLFNTAKELELYAMSKEFRPHTESSLETRALIGCLLDFWSIDRKAFSSSIVVV